MPPSPIFMRIGKVSSFRMSVIIAEKDPSAVSTYSSPLLPAGLDATEMEIVVLSSRPRSSSAFLAVRHRFSFRLNLANARPGFELRNLIPQQRGLLVFEIRRSMHHLFL